MRLLVLGGTAWLGGELARQAVGAGDEVVCLARGVSGAAPPGARLVRADRSRPGALDAVAGVQWDAVVEVCWQPGLVRSAVAALAPAARHWTYVSSCSVYADQSGPGLTEDAALLPALDTAEATRERYGEAKSACEQLSREGVEGPLLVVRAGLIAGRGDRSDRFGYWPARFARGGDVLVPDALGLPTQAIDVEDLARWILAAARARVGAVCNAVGPVVPLGEVLDLARAAAAHRGGLVLADPAWLRDQGVEEFGGPESLSLWIHDPAYAGFSLRDGSAAVDLGLRHRPRAELVAAALGWERELGLDRDRQAGLSPGREADLLRAWRGRAG